MSKTYTFTPKFVRWSDDKPKNVIVILGNGKSYCARSHRHAELIQRNIKNPINSQFW